MRARSTRATITWLVAVASWLTTAAICHAVGAQQQPAILAALVGIGLAHRSPVSSLRRVLLAPVALAAIALIAIAIATLIRVEFALGALVFTAAMFGSVWLRNFGERGRAASAVVALPLVGMLIVPGRANAPGGLAVDIALAVAAGVIPLAYAWALAWFARLVGLADDESASGAAPSRAAAPPARTGSLSISTRMALQLAVAIAAAFIAGRVLFATHWSWAVLTAFIVCHAARGRGDAVYKGVLRLGGAAAGTIAAAGLGTLSLAGPSEALAIVVVLFLGLQLREINYAYWACGMTLILALLAGPDGRGGLGLLEMRLAAILVGAVCGAAAAWFVLPIRTEAVIRRRLADALRALDDVLADAADQSEARGQNARLDHCLREIERVAPPVRWHRRLVRGRHGSEHPAHWVDVTLSACRRLRALDGPARPSRERRAALRRKIGITRRAIADHHKTEREGRLPIGAALDDLHTIATTTPPPVAAAEHAPTH
jgi:hypothetical protein